MNPRKSIRKPEVGETETRIGETGSERNKNKERGKQEVGETKNEGRRSVCCAAVIFQAYL